MVQTNTYALVQPELLEGEEIVWSGQPEPGIRFMMLDIFLIPFSLFFAGIPLLGLSGTVFSIILNPNNLTVAAIPVLVFTFLFSVFGLYLLIGRFLYKRWKNRQTHYVLTNRRALVLVLAFGRRVNAVFLDRLATMNKIVRSNGIGTVFLGSPSWMTSVYGNSGLDMFWGLNSGDVLAFYDIRDVNNVFDLANRLRRDRTRLR